MKGNKHKLIERRFLDLQMIINGMLTELSYVQCPMFSVRIGTKAVDDDLNKFEVMIAKSKFRNL